MWSNYFLVIHMNTFLAGIKPKYENISPESHDLSKGGLTYVVLEPVLSGFETKNLPALWEASSSSIFAARQASLYN